MNREKSLAEWLEEGVESNGPFPATLPDISSAYRLRHTERIVLGDGISLSIQASQYHYCMPRETLPYAEYESFEIGFPSECIEELLPYAEESDKPTQTVYPYVPKGIIEAVIVGHGGIVGHEYKG
jgi:hypothetical protein